LKIARVAMLRGLFFVQTGEPGKKKLNAEYTESTESTEKHKN
jgi:hypothetical protein